MFEHFDTFITAEAPFTKEELRLMRSLATERKLRKKELLLHEGEVCRNKAFVVKGLLRTFGTKEDGTEFIMRFAPENNWMVDAESYNSGMPSKYSIEALEDTELIAWSRENVEKMFVTIPAFKLYTEKLITSTLEASQNRVLMNISYTAEEAYQEFISAFPDVFARVPLHMVASYLGVSRETLSRIRRSRVYSRVK